MKALFRNKPALALVVVVSCALMMAAGVNGIFNSVNSALGYKVAGGAGSSGQALCSGGTLFDTPCFLYYQTIQEAGSPLTQQPVFNFDGTVVAAAGSGKTNIGLPAVGTAGTYIYPVSITTDTQGRVSAVTAGATASACRSFTPTVTSGCTVLPDGTWEEWGHSGTLADGSPGTNVCFPVAFPTAVLNVTLSDDFAASATSTPSVAGLAPNAGASPFPCANGGFWAWGTRAGNAVYWKAIGN